jgi:hypothetical protein
MCNEFKIFHSNLIRELEKKIFEYDINCIGILFPNQGPVGVVQLRSVLCESLSIPTLVIRVNQRLIRNQIWFERNDMIYPPLSPKSNIMLFCDAATSGASIYKAALIARRFGAKCNFAFAIFDRLQGAEDKLNTKGIKLVSLIDRNFFEAYEELHKDDISHDKKASRFEFESIKSTI